MGVLVWCPQRRVGAFGGGVCHCRGRCPPSRMSGGEEGAGMIPPPPHLVGGGGPRRKVPPRRAVAPTLAGVIAAGAELTPTLRGPTSSGALWFPHGVMARTSSLQPAVAMAAVWKEPGSRHGRSDPSRPAEKSIQERRFCSATPHSPSGGAGPAGPPRRWSPVPSPQRFLVRPPSGSSSPFGVFGSRRSAEPPCAMVDDPPL